MFTLIALISIFAGSPAEADFTFAEKNFRLIDSRGESHSLGYLENLDAVLLLAWPGNCADREKILAWYSAWEPRLNEKKIAVLWINASRPQNRAEVEQLRAARFHAPVLMDFSQTISKSFGFASGGDYVLLSTKPWAVVSEGKFSGELDHELMRFSSPLSKWHSLLLKARVLSQHWMGSSLNCPIPYNSVGQLKFDSAMARRFFTTCGSCHSKFPSLDFFKTDKDIFSWAAMNRTVMRNYLMPPMGFDYHSESEQCSSPLNFSLTEENLSQLLAWLEQGAPHESGEDITSTLRKEALAENNNPHGSRAPDLIWKMKEPHRVRAEGPDFYKSAQLAGPLKSDLKISGVTLKSNVDVSRHVQVWALSRPFNAKRDLIDMAGTQVLRVFDERFHLPTEKLLFGFSLGVGFKKSPEGTVITVPKGSYVVALIHYEPTGKIETNQAALELILDKSGQPKSELETLPLPPKSFSIPPHAKNFSVTSELLMTSDVFITGIYGHFHRRGTAFRFELVTPDKKEKVVCNVPFRQFKYDLPIALKPTFAPKGSVIRAQFIYDNSAQNPANPDPEATVGAGSSTKNSEMAVSFVTFYRAKMKISPGP